MNSLDRLVLTGAALGALTAAPARAQWAEASSTRFTDRGALVRLEGAVPNVLGIPMNYGFADLERHPDGTTTFYSQAQFSHEFGTGALKPTLGLEYQAASDDANGVRAQVGADLDWKGGNATVRIAPKLAPVRLGLDNDLQNSLTLQQSIGDLALSGWLDNDLNHGQRPLTLGEVQAQYPLGKIQGSTVYALAVMPYVDNSARLRVGVGVGF